MIASRLASTKRPPGSLWRGPRIVCTLPLPVAGFEWEQVASFGGRPEVSLHDALFLSFSSDFLGLSALIRFIAPAFLIFPPIFHAHGDVAHTGTGAGRSRRSGTLFEAASSF
jgi:hypothetical protein